ncbi:hypothetical protein SAMN02799631_04567 [Methylobacterium sp. 174MFSha1.1]|uniref:hypothetical protein n=1 Tax=Methylobacterium sp. 174MFSha1.1 TaxID=1502749 RepID=UPI0008F0E4E3|nr:hypothetical protein [Methylobacterium sp. 174MFSha1.1]SFV07483.1 hypothetical protein SAMN02799631_04567 [Methylobacterium sp. 174MFSha1.1]
MSNNRTPKKDRIGEINIGINAEDHIEFDFNKEKQTVSIRVMRDGSPVKANHQHYTTYYERKSKPKFINAIEFQSAKDFTLDHYDALRVYSQVWAIDTNSDVFFDNKICVSVCSECTLDEIHGVVPKFAILFGATAANPERYAWRHYIEMICKCEGYSETEKYALIVDSDINKIFPINHRKEPVHGTFYLPENWCLIYATADKPADSFINRAISVSDKTAKTILNGVGARESNKKYFSPIDDEEEPNFLRYEIYYEEDRMIAIKV